MFLFVKIFVENQKNVAIDRGREKGYHKERLGAQH